MSLRAVVASATQDGTWVNDPVTVVVRNPTQGGVGKNNKPKPSKCVFVDPKDPNATLNACWFGGSFLQYEDQVITISGKSNKVSVYNGTAEFSIGKEGVVTSNGPAPDQLGGPPPDHGAHGSAPGTGGHNQPPPPATGDPAAIFHRGMGKAALLWAHAFQYAKNVEVMLFGEGKTGMHPDLFQSLTSSMFITAKDNGALVKPLPKLRLTDDKGVPFKFIPEQPDPEAVKRAAEAAAAEAAKKAADAARAAQSNLDEDVPF